MADDFTYLLRVRDLTLGYHIAGPSDAHEATIVRGTSRNLACTCRPRIWDYSKGVIIFGGLKVSSEVTVENVHQDKW